MSNKVRRIFSKAVNLITSATAQGLSKGEDVYKRQTRYQAADKINCIIKSLYDMSVGFISINIQTDDC